MLSPTLGLLISLFLLLLLLRFDPSQGKAESPALWVPVIWMLIVGSRLPSQWLFSAPTASIATTFEEGSGLDRTVYLLLILIALYILGARRIDWPELLARNAALTLFVLYALASVMWSDFPLVTFKRWIRDLGLYFMVIVVRSDARPFSAISTVIRRVSYILIPLSVALIKYFPEIGVIFDPWTGQPEYVGVALTKNTLGPLCLVSGLFYFWDILGRWSERRNTRTKKILFVDIVLMTMTLWLLNLSQSATSQGCLAIGCLIIVAIRSKWARTNPGLVTAGIPSVLLAYVVLGSLFDISSLVAQIFERDPTMTGRTNIWKALLAMHTNPLLGVGYQSFWLGERMMEAWRRLGVKTFLNEAHNGYIEIYLNLGLIGLGLLGAFMLTSYGTLRRQLTRSPHEASFGLAVWVITLIHNVTEASVLSSLIWCVLLFSVVVVPRRKSRRMRQLVSEIGESPS